jgi:hypothetical protein
MSDEAHKKFKADEFFDDGRKKTMREGSPTQEDQGAVRGFLWFFLCHSIKKHFKMENCGCFSMRI